MKVFVLLDRTDEVYVAGVFRTKEEMVNHQVTMWGEQEGDEGKSYEEWLGGKYFEYSSEDLV